MSRKSDDVKRKMNKWKDVACGKKRNEREKERNESKKKSENIQKGKRPHQGTEEPQHGKHKSRIKMTIKDWRMQGN